MNPISHEPDPFNYPFPKRSQLMSLSTINETQDFLNSKTKKFQSERHWNHNLKTDDIEGTKTKVPGYQFTKKEVYSNQNWDIDRAGPRALHLGLNKPEYNLTNNDIDKSKPQFQKFQTKRVVNPMNPNYSLPKAEIIQAEPPKFIRDNITNDDIDGAKPKKPKYFATRETMKVDDIEGTKSKPYPNRKTRYSSYDYSDVTNDKFKSKRVTNPLNPSYFHKTEDGKVEEIGNIEGSRPKVPNIRKRGPKEMSLNVNDIDGTQTSSKGLRAFKTHTRREYRQVNRTDDISGTQVGSLLKAPVTNRVVNPLNPVYPLLGARELGENNNEYAQENFRLENKPSTAPVKTRNRNKRKFEHNNNLDKEVFKRDIAKFYSTNPGFMQEVDFKEIKNACKPPVPPKPIEVHINKDEQKDFGRNSKKFYGQPLSEKSEYSRARAEFYGTNNLPKVRPQTDHLSSRKELTTQQMMDEYKTDSVNKHRKTTTDLLDIQNKQHFKKDTANFYGESYKSSEKGSIFQGNAAEFYGLPKPQNGEKIIDPDEIVIPKNKPPKQSVLNERRLKAHELNMQRHPMYGKNIKRFWGLKSQGKFYH